MKIFDTIKGIDTWPFLIIIGISATSHHVPTLPEQFYTIRLHIEVVLFVLPIAVVSHIEYTVFLHRFDDGLKVVLTRRHVFQNDTIFDALAIR